MGTFEADHASPMGVPANMPIEGYEQQPAWSAQAAPAPEGAAAPDASGRPPQNTPLWMDASPAQPEARRGVTPAPRSGLHTLVFFGLIIFVVGAAGIGGVAIWGPEKTIKNRTQFATNPPAPTPLPSLPEATDPPAAPPAAEAAPAPAESAAAAPAASAPAKKGKKAPKGWGKKTH